MSFKLFKWHKIFLYTLHHLSLILTSYISIINDQNQETNIYTILLTNQRPYSNITNYPTNVFSWSRKKRSKPGSHSTFGYHDSLVSSLLCFVMGFFFFPMALTILKSTSHLLSGMSHNVGLCCNKKIHLVFVPSSCH